MRMLRKAGLCTALIAACFASAPCVVAEDAASSRSSLHAQAADTPAQAEPSWNPTPDEIRGPDRGHIEAEIKAAMNLTPPGRQVRLDLRSGSSLILTVSAYEVGPGETDCRTFHYRYQAFRAGSAEVVGRRCWFERTGWRALQPDELLASDGLTDARSDPSEDRSDPVDPGPLSQTPRNESVSSELSSETPSKDGLREDSKTPDAALADPGVPEADDKERPTAPSRIILPFIVDQSGTESR